MKRTLLFLLVFVIAVPLSASMGGHQRIMMPSPVAGMNSMAMELAPDGTVVTTRTVAGNGSVDFEVVAVTPAGTVAWSWKADQPVSYVKLAGSNVIVTTTPMSSPMGIEPVTTVRALSLTDGHEVWKTSIDGMAMKIDTTSTTIYVLGTAGMMIYGTDPNNMMNGGGAVVDARTLYAISASSGAILWSLALSPSK